MRRVVLGGFGAGVSYLAQGGSSVLRRVMRSFATPSFQRSTLFAEVTDQDVDHFRTLLGPEGVISDPVLLQPFNEGWMGRLHGSSRLALRPKSTQQVSRILSYCNERRLAVVPQGGNTGLVQGSVPVFDEVILLMSGMDRVLSFDESSGALVCEAGCILENMMHFLEERGHIMPLDLGAKGSCQIGGNVATHAGGLHVIRWGPMRGWLLGLEAVLADGTILENLSTVRKDNTGYDLKQLFVGSEGTLGVVTAVSLLAPQKPKCVNAAFLGCQSFEKVVSLFGRAKRDLSEILSAFEFEDQESMRAVLNQIPGTRDPFDTTYPFYALVETMGSDLENDDKRLMTFLEEAMESGTVENGVVAQDTAQIQALWALRENVAESVKQSGRQMLKYDVSIPVGRMYELVEETRRRLGDRAIVVGYGHLGDSNLHLNVYTHVHQPDLEERVDPFLYEWIGNVKGSISAEHGIGTVKSGYLHQSKSPQMIALMRTIKKLLDPKGILNPYKVLPVE